MRASLTVTADASSLVAEMRKGSEGLREMRREAEASAKAAAMAASEQGRMAEKLNRSFSGFGASQKSARDSASVFAANLDQRELERARAEQAVRAYRAIEESLNPLIRAERELAEAQAVVNRALAEGQITNTAAARSLQQLQDRHAAFVRAQSPAAQSARAFEAAIEAEAAEMRQLMLALDPTARAQAEFARVQNQVTRAVRMGIVSQDEANRVMQLFEARQKAIGKGGFAMAGGLQNASYQMTDIIVQMQSGQAAGVILAQQLPQLLGGFGALGAAMGLVAAVGAPLLASWLMGEDAAASLDERLQKLETTLGSVEDRMKLLGDQRLDETFGNMTDDIREMTSALLALERASELKQLRDSLDSIMGENVDLSFWQKLNRPLWGEGRQEFTRMITGWNYAEMTGGRGPSLEEFQQRRASLDERARLGDREGVVRETASLIDRFTEGGAFTDLDENLARMLLTLGQVAQKTAEVNALFNGTGRANAITRQIDEMVRASQQQAEMSQAILKFGEDSAEVDAVRARHAREALETQLREIKVAKGSLEEKRAMAALDAELAASADLRAQAKEKEAKALIADLTRQGEMSSAILSFGKDSAEVEALRARHAREVNDERLKEMGLAPGLLALAQKLFAVEQARARQIRDGEASRKADQMITDLREQAGISRAVALYGRDSLQVKELQIAAERRAYAESLKTLQVSAERKRQMMAEWEVAKGLASADPFGQVAASREMLRAQRERVQQLRLEQALLGQSEAVRSRIVALWKVEQEMQRQGIDLTGVRAEEIRRAAIEEDEFTRSVERQKDAWASVETAAESAIDSIFDKLVKGDWQDALEEMAQSLAGTFYELSIKNPAKNAILGRDLPTMADIGGLQGIWARLSGRGDGSGIALPDQTGDVATMQVEAATVVLGGPGVVSLLAGSPGAANSISAPGSLAGFGGADAVQSRIWQYFSAKGLQPHQIAALMGQAAVESSFDPRAVGDSGTSFGIFQHHAGRGQGLLNAVGGMAGLGNIDAQLEFVWKELLTSENGILKRLMSSTSLKDATIAAIGYERPKGWTAADPTSAPDFDRRLAAAEAALARFGATAQTATSDLGTLGNGMGVFGAALKGFAQGGPEGALQGLLGSVGKLAGSWFGIPGFASGGDFAGGLRLVGEKGPELEFTGPSRIMNAELTRQLLSARSMPPANIAAAPIVQIQPVLVNNTGRPVRVETEESIDARGLRQHKYVISDLTAQGIQTRGGAASRAMREMGYAPPTRRRPG